MIAIIGGGISGIAAAKTLSENNKDFLLFEKENIIGGHQLTFKLDGCLVDVGFIYGHKRSYKELIDLIKELNLKKITHKIEYASYDKNNIIFSNKVHSKEFLDEIKKIKKLASNRKKIYWLYTFSYFLKKYSFTERFIKYVIEPNLSIFFVTGNDAFNKPAYIILGMINDEWVSLENNNNKNLWSVKGGNNQIINGIIRKYKFKNKIKLNEKVLAVKKNNKFILETTKNKYIFDDIIIACNLHNIVKFYSPETYMQKLLFNLLLDKQFKSYGILHNYNKIIPKNNGEYYFFNKTKETWQLSGVLGCGWILTISPTIITDIPENFIFKKFKWWHPNQDLKYLLFVILLNRGLINIFETNKVYFCGSWTTILSHNYAYKSGIYAAERVMKTKKNFESLLAVIIFIIIIIVVNKNL